MPPRGFPEAEINKIRHVRRLTSEAFEALPQGIAMGMSEHETEWLSLRAAPEMAVIF
jgi:hypothetical protein